MAAVADFLRRTPLARALPTDATWGALADAAVVMRTGAERADAAVMLADLSPLPRLGIKGREAIAAARKRGVTVEAEPNRAFRQADGGLCLVLGAGDLVLLGALDGSAGFDALEESFKMDDGERAYPLARRDSHGWLAVAGREAPTLFAKLCAVDLRPRKFADLAIAQTSVARLNAVVVRADRGERLTYHLLADSASATYLWASLTDAAAEYGGIVVGLDEIRA